MLVVNSSIAQYTRSGAMKKLTTFQDWFASLLPVVCPSGADQCLLFDPCIRYDQLHGRFLFLAAALDLKIGFSHLMLSVSNGATYRQRLEDLGAERRSGWEHSHHQLGRFLAAGVRQRGRVPGGKHVHVRLQLQAAVREDPSAEEIGAVQPGYRDPHVQGSVQPEPVKQGWFAGCVNHPGLHAREALDRKRAVWQCWGSRFGLRLGQIC
jgi:hypothetical protein